MAKIEKRAIRFQRQFFGAAGSLALTSAAVTSAAVTSAAVLLMGCSGSVDSPAGGLATAGTSGSAGTGGGIGGTANVTMNVPVDANGNPIAAVDPGRVGLHRLNNAEYNNTVRDLMMDVSAPATAFLAEEGANGFDNTASSLGMTSAQFEKYMNAAAVVVDGAFANTTWTTANLSCTPTAASDACVTTLLGTLGQRIYRRPLTDAEKAAALAVYDADFARVVPGDPALKGVAALKEMVRAMMTSANFLYRVEAPADPASTTAQSLSGYELASRLSYLHWSTMPDDALFQAAAAGQLADMAQLEAQVDRMLIDPKANEFLTNFGGQWLDYRKLLSHSVTATVFPTFTTALQDAMIAEGKMWFSDFVQGDRPLSDWFTAETDFLNGPLAAHYGYAAPADPAAFARVDTPGDARVGFMGLAHFLTNSSFPGRTTPTKRAVWVLENLLCTPPPMPPANVPKLEDTPEPGSAAPDPATIVNVKERLAAHRENPQCKSCHENLDPIGLALENFDAIGSYRTTYSNGDVIDATGTFGVAGADGTKTPQPFVDVPSLAALLATDARFAPCVAEHVLSYALGRGIEATDEPYLAQINTQWATRGVTIRNLLKTVVVNDTFRFSRGETQ